MRFLKLWKQSSQFFVACLGGQCIGPHELLLLDTGPSEESFVVLPLLLQSGNEFLLELPKQNIGSLNLSLEALVGALQVYCCLGKL